MHQWLLRIQRVKEKEDPQPAWQMHTQKQGRGGCGAEMNIWGTLGTYDRITLWKYTKYKVEYVGIPYGRVP